MALDISRYFAKLLLSLVFVFDASLFAWGSSSNNVPVIKQPVDASTWETDYNENDTVKVSTVQADDDDNDDITYSLEEADDSDLFNIDSSSGDLTFKNSPDYENPQDSNTDNDYVVTVIADDSSDTDKIEITVHIKDVDDQKASIGDETIKETNGDQSLTFTITLDSAAPSGGSKVDWALSDDTATDGEDYVKSNGTVSIAEGDTSGTFDVTIKGDDVDEDTETFKITLTANSNAEIDDGDGVGTITDDDGSNCTKSGTIDLRLNGEHKYGEYWDAEQQGDSATHSSSDLEMMYDGDDRQDIGIVFQGVNIEQGCYVKKAYIQFTAKGATKEQTSVVIYGEDEDNATWYKDDRKVTDATKTEKSVNWKNIQEWDDGQSDGSTRTANVSCIAEHILGRDGWTKGSNMGFILEPDDDCGSSDCNRRAYADGQSDESYGPVLHIEYSDKKADSVPCQIAVDDNYDVRMGDSNTLDVTANDDSGIDDDSVSVKTEPTHGTYEIDGNNIIYTPDDGFKGDDNLTYTVTLSGQESNEAFVTLNVNIKGGDVDFHIINPPETRNIQGNYFIGGNMIECRADNEDSECQSHEGTNEEYMKYIDIDDDDDTYNSSSFTLELPEKSKVIWAGLFWGGFIHNTPDEADHDWRKNDEIIDAKTYNGNEGLDLSDNTYDTDKVKFKTPDSDAYKDVNATAVYFSKWAYSSYSNITHIFDNDDALKNNPNGAYTLANVSLNHKKKDEHGNSGGWSMVVIYTNPDADYKNVSIFHGLKDVTDKKPVDMNVSGFLVPNSENVKAKLSFMTHDGDGGDCYFKLNDTKIGLWTDANGNEHDDRDSVYNSTIIGVPKKNPDFDLTDDKVDYYSSFEIDTYDASDVLQPGDTTANIKMEQVNDAAFDVPLIIFSADMYTPKFCYDYAYKQNDYYFTEENNGTEAPRIIGDVDTNTPVDVEIYLRNNEDSDLKAVDFSVDFEDINTSQATYKRETTWVTQPNSTNRVSISDDDLNVSDEYDKNISIDNIDSQDYFYTGYSLTPQKSDLNMSITGYAKYNLLLDDKKIILPRIRIDGDRIPICAKSGDYNASRGAFNVVHNNYYANNNGDKYYNLPTQVTQKVGNFNIISLKKDSEDLKNRTTIVGIEMIDVDAFHDVKASCDEMNNVLGARLWVTFDNNVSTTKFDKDVVPTSFYNRANRNTAFRVTYNTDENGTAIQLDNDDNNYIIKNYDDVIEPNGDDCLDGSGQTIEHACGGNGESISKTKLTGCMQCIFGRHTSAVCSRDNFALRPEAISLQISDQNQTDGSNKEELSGDTLNLASGYKYFLELNATNHANSNAVVGYQTTVDANLSWNSSQTGCNDKSNQIIPLAFVDGKVSLDISVNQVGEYLLDVNDTTWSSVDQNPQNHQDDGNFTTANNNFDCVNNSNIVAKTGEAGDDNTPLNGCEIGSDHNNTDANLTYKDYKVHFHPYKIETSSTIELPTSHNFIYMSDISKDENMSVTLNATISAKGYNGGFLTNFVKECYAEEINLDILKTRATTGGGKYKYNFNNYAQENNDSSIISSDEINTTLDDANKSITISLDSKVFQKENNGTIYTKVYLNFDRNNSGAQNPQEMNFTAFNVKNGTEFSADLVTDKTAETNTTLNKHVIYYYGRSHTTRQSFQGKNGKAPITYEVYCYGTKCDKTLLQGTTYKYSDDPRWFINPNHDTNQLGEVYSTQQKTDSKVSTTTTLNSIDLAYDESVGYPYITTMQSSPSSWLIYNKYNESDTKNEFQVKFFKGGTGWNGGHETNTATVDSGSALTNKKLIW